MLISPIRSPIVSSLRSSVSSISASGGVDTLSQFSSQFGVQFSGGVAVPEFTYPAPSTLIFNGGTKAVDKWDSDNSFGSPLRQSTVGDQPSLSGDTYVFVNSQTDHMTRELQAPTNTPTQKQIPNCSYDGEIVDRGYAITGLAKDLKTGYLYTGNHGGISPHPDATLNAGINVLTSDGGVLVREFDMGLGGSDSIQGVSYDKTRDAFWMVTTEATRRAVLFNKETGVEIRSFNLGSTANGSAYDYVNDWLYIMANTGVISKYDASDGTLLTATVTTMTGSAPDCLHFDPVYGILWATRGTSGASSFIRGYSIALAIWGDEIQVTDTLAIEGCLISDDGTSLVGVANDGYYHNGGAELNGYFTFDFDLREQIIKLYSYVTAWQADLIYKRNSPPSGAKVIVAINDPVGEKGSAIYMSSGSATNIQVLNHDGTTLESDTLTLGASSATRFHLTVRVDLIAKTIKLYQNGVQQGATATIALTVSNLRILGIGLCGNYDGSDIRWADADVDECVVTLGLKSDADTNALGQGWAATYGHPYTDIGLTAASLAWSDGSSITWGDTTSLEWSN